MVPILNSPPPQPTDPGRPFATKKPVGFFAPSRPCSGGCQTLLVKLVTLSDGAARIGKQPSQLRYWTEKGVLESFKVERRGQVLSETYVRLEDVEMLAELRGWAAPKNGR
jgi:hypothetical protein